MAMEKAPGGGTGTGHLRELLLRNPRGLRVRREANRLSASAELCDKFPVQSKITGHGFCRTINMLSRLAPRSHAVGGLGFAPLRESPARSRKCPCPHHK